MITLAYLARFMHAVFLGQPGRNLDHIEEAPWVMRAPMLLMAFMVILTGVFPRPDARAPQCGAGGIRNAVA